MDHKFITSLAFCPPSDSVKHVSEVANGLSCKCICQICGGRLEAVQATKTNRKWYFRHYSKFNCKGNLESLLHKYAKQVIVEARSIVRTKNHMIHYQFANSEESIDPYRPDITLCLENGEKVYIEVFVSNEVKEIKKDYFVANQYKSFEVDLCTIKDRNKLVEVEDLKRKILQNWENRRMLYWPEDLKKTENGNEGCLGFVVIPIVALLAFITFGPFKKTKWYSKRRIRSRRKVGPKINRKGR